MVKHNCLEHDSYFDTKTGEWLEGKCADEDCMFCSGRPKRHKPHKWGKVVCK